MRTDRRAPRALPGLDLDQLARFFADQLPEVGQELSAELIDGGRSNLTYLVTDGLVRFVVRRQPLGDVAPTANDIVREYRVMAALCDSPVPVPRAIALCEDPEVMGVPFSVVTFVEGTVVRSPQHAAALTPDEAARVSTALVDTLATLHGVDPAEVGLAGFGRPDGYLERQVDRWRRQWEIVATRSLPAIDRLHRLLRDRIPHSSTVGVVHGDYRLDNTILAPGAVGRIEAVVDWEMATLGDPLMDLALLVAYWNPVTASLLADGHAPSGNPGFLTAEALVDRYLATTGAAGVDLGFYLGLAYFKLAVIAEGIHARHVSGQTVGDGFDTVGDAVVPLAEAGLEVLR